VFIAAFGQAPSAASGTPSAPSDVAAVAVSTKDIFAAGGAASPLRVWSLDGAEIPLDPAMLQAAHITPDLHVSALAYDVHSGDLLLLDAQACRVLRLHVHL